MSLPFRYKVHVPGWGYTFCKNGAELDQLLRLDMGASEWHVATITIDKIPTYDEVVAQ